MGAHGKLLVQVLGVHNLGTDYPRIIVTCLANGTAMSWTFLPLATAKNQFVSTPGGYASEPSAEGAPRLLIQVQDAVKGDEKSLGTAALDISGLLQPPHVAELWVPIENAKKAGAAVNVRASFVVANAAGAAPAPAAAPMPAAPPVSPAPPPRVHSDYADRISAADGGYTRFGSQAVLPVASDADVRGEQSDGWLSNLLSFRERPVGKGVPPLPPVPGDVEAPGLFACCGAGRLWSNCAPSLRNCSTL
eukprot:tig00021332_g20327.t1